jgi:uncharacterized membrane-anchored protein
VERRGHVKSDISRYFLLVIAVVILVSIQVASHDAALPFEVINYQLTTEVLCVVKNVLFCLLFVVFLLLLFAMYSKF